MTKHTVAQVEDMIATEDNAEVSAMLREYATLLAEKEKAEPVSRVDDLERGGRVRALAIKLSLDAPLYAHPPAKEERK